MSRPFSIMLEHVRGFSKPTELPVKPLTLIVGENSTGKTTFLAMLSYILDSTRFPLSSSFNEPPYELGSFDTIATFKGGKYGRDIVFSIGFDILDRAVRATYSNHQGTPRLTKLTIDTTDQHAQVNFDGNEINFKLQGDNIRPVINFSAKVPKIWARESNTPSLRLFDIIVGQFLSRDFKRNNRQLHHILSILQLVDPRLGPVISAAPIRSKPRRTYDRFIDAFDPEGEHIPTTLARALRKGADAKERDRLETALKSFGEASGLFKKIAIKTLGKGATNPYQIFIVGDGPPVNLVDVGYGVSQGLPLIAQTALSPDRAVHLIQQPEVHLHPRAQAALGTYFSEMCRKDGTYVIIETHSDYLIDRVRQEIARKTISHKNVSLLFFSKDKLETHVDAIGFDPDGNIVEAPASYRDFFFEEQMNLFSLTSIHANDH